MNDTSRLIRAAQDVGRLDYAIKQLSEKRDRINDRIESELCELERQREDAAEIVRQEGGK